MKSPQIVSTILSAALICPVASGGFAQSAPPEPAPASSVERQPASLAQAIAALKQADQEYLKKVEEARNIVEEEASAKRISESVAQSLRSSLRTAALSEGRRVSTSVRIPKDCEALARVFNELDALGNTAGTKRLAQLEAVRREIRNSLVSMLEGSPTSEEIAAQIELQRSVIDPLRQGPGSYEDSNLNSSSMELLTALRRLRDAEAKRVARDIVLAASQLRGMGSSNSFYQSAVQGRVDRAMQPLRASVTEKEAALEAAIRGRKPATEVTTALSAYQDALAPVASLRGSGMDEQMRMDNRSNAYRAIVEAYRSIADGDDAMLSGRLEQARSAVRNSLGDRSGVFEGLLAQVEKDAAEKGAALKKVRYEGIRARMVAAKEAADLEKLSSDLYVWGRERQMRGGESESLIPLGSQIGALASAWSSGGLTVLQQSRYTDPGISVGAFAGDLQALRKRVERDVFSRAVNAPELLKPPLVEKPLEEAMETLCDDLAKAAEWRRLYKVLEGRASAQSALYGRLTPDDTMTALRAFFAAENFELAEQWADAIQSYKSVLRSASLRAPTKPAAERVKVLVEKHGAPPISTDLPAVPPAVEK
jgi:hypothetical protein